MSRVEPEAIVGRSVRRWLLAQLPAKVAQVNAERAAVLPAPQAGPFNIGANSTLAFCFSPIEDTFTVCPLTVGIAQTSAQVAADINAVAPGRASVDEYGCWQVTSPLPPAPNLASVVRLRGSNPADANAVFGFDPGGDRAVCTALNAPTSKGVTDGLPLFTEMGPRGNGANGVIVVVIGGKRAKPVHPQRTDEHLVAVDLSILRIDPQQQVHRSREHIYASLRCVREVLLSQRGLMLGRGPFGDIMKVTELNSSVLPNPVPFRPDPKSDPEWLSDGATLQLEIRVYARPNQSTGAVVVTPSVSALTAAATLQLAAAQIVNGAPTDITATATWASSNTAVATVSASGLVTWAGTGTTTITASFDGWASGTCTIDAT